MGPGRLLGGRYELVERIGAGGMGEVWRATDSTLRRPVAVKVLHTALAADDAFRRRFIQEAHALAAVNQPGVVNIFDVGDDTDEAGNTVSYLVMEFVSGRPLSQILSEQGPMPPDRMLRLVGQVAQGLDAAHRAGIVHRDVKPANILINKNDEATILDFGIARRDGVTGLTTTGAVMGTVEYASPEQLQGGELTGASDVYSLGIVAYECVAGRRPFSGETVAAIIAGHLHREPPPLPDRIPAEVVRVIKIALEKDPRQRFGSAAQFARACQDPRSLPAAAVPGPPTRKMSRGIAAPAAKAAASEPSAPARAPRPQAPAEPAPKRRRGALVAAGVVALFLVAAGVAVYFTVWPDGVSAGESNDTGWTPATELTTPTDGDESTTPEPPAGPTDQPTQLVNVGTERCLDIGSAGVTTVDCDEDPYKDFTLAPFTSNNVHGYQILDEGDKCVVWPKKNQIKGVDQEECGQNPNWVFTWLASADGSDTWMITTPEGTDDVRCLSDVDNAAKATECVEGDQTQQWQTTSA